MIALKFSGLGRGALPLFAVTCGDHAPASAFMTCNNCAKVSFLFSDRVKRANAATFLLYRASLFSANACNLLYILVRTAILLVLLIALLQ